MSFDASPEEPVDPQHSFEQFYLDHWAALYRASLALTGNGAEAEDVAQQAFAQVWDRWDRVTSMDDPEGYLFRTAMNVFRSRYRRALRAVRLPWLPREEIDPLGQVDARHDAFRALRLIPVRQRAAVVLTELLGHSTEDAAAILRITPGAVRTLASRGRASLARALEDSDD